MIAAVATTIATIAAGVAVVLAAVAAMYARRARDAWLDVRQPKGGPPRGVIHIDGTITETQAARIREMLHKRHSVTMQPAIARTPPEAAMSLITTIETDLTAAGHEVSGILHGILAKHLTLENIAAHVAQGVATAQGDPLVQLGESLLPGGGAVIAEFVGKLATFLAPAAEAVTAAPAEVPAGQAVPA